MWCHVVSCQIGHEYFKMSYENHILTNFWALIGEQRKHYHAGKDATILQIARIVVERSFLPYLMICVQTPHWKVVIFNSFPSTSWISISHDCQLSQKNQRDSRISGQSPKLPKNIKISLFFKFLKNFLKFQWKILYFVNLSLKKVQVFLIDCINNTIILLVNCKKVA